MLELVYYYLNVLSWVMLYAVPILGLIYGILCLVKRNWK